MCKGSYTIEVYFLPRKCPTLLKANGESGGGAVPSHSGTQVHGGSAVFSIWLPRSLWWFSVSSGWRRVVPWGKFGRVYQGVLEVAHITSIHTPLARIQTYGIAKMQSRLRNYIAGCTTYFASTPYCEGERHIWGNS